MIVGFITIHLFCKSILARFLEEQEKALPVLCEP
jgi:hypothetical protein